MDDSSEEILRCEPARIRRLLELRLEPLWRKEEYGQILANQLAIPVAHEVHCRAGTLPESERAWLNRTFAEVFGAQEPPGSILRLIKDFAKEDRMKADGHLPKEISTILYFAAIAHALSARGERITSLRNDQIRTGITWALQQDWLPDRLRTVFSGCCRCVEKSEAKI